MRLIFVSAASLRFFGMSLSDESRNFWNAYFNPFHTLFFLYQLRRRRRYAGYFDTVEKSPLTAAQRRAIILNERRNLVVAGAGTGKTATVIGKVGYLLESGLCSPDEILVIAYNTDAASELRKRISDRLGVNVEAQTFHVIGKTILRDSGLSFRLSDFLGQEEKLEEFLGSVLEDCLKDDETRNLYTRFFSKYEFPYKDEHKDFGSYREYCSWVRTNYFLTLNGERTKSFGELLIANFLYANGVAYSYEKEYSPNNRMPLDAFYRPDFYIPAIDSYIEYFGTDEHGKTASYIDSDEYNRQMAWKIETHKKGNTNLIQLFYHQNRDGVMLKELRRVLKSRGLVLEQRSPDEILEKINESTKNEKFLKLAIRFLDQFQENRSVTTLSSLRRSVRGDERSVLFLNLFEIIYERYRSVLSEKNSIDFGEMISRSADIVKSGRYAGRWRYIIIDEFQDISSGRYELVRSLLDQNRKIKLFCVGDDWQAIYRFAGSDHLIMNDFRKFFGRSTILNLDINFRSNNKISRVAETFITMNLHQRRKDISTLATKSGPQIFLRWTSDDMLSSILETIGIIQQTHDTTSKSLQILCRYHRTHQKIRSPGQFGRLRSLWRGDVNPPMTIHSSKGLEADFVIVADLNSEKSGFPSMRDDDPVLGLVLSSSDGFLHSEERRLFYVALTRAREQVYLVANPEYPSVFAEELESGRYEVSVTGTKQVKHPCPSCEDGAIVKQEVGDDFLFGCVNFPVCNEILPKCDKCKESPIERTKLENGLSYGVCLNEDCDEKYEACPKCEEGVLVPKKGYHGVFLGCHTYSRTRCDAIKKLPSDDSVSDESSR